MKKVFITSLSLIALTSLMPHTAIADSGIKKAVCELPLSASSIAVATAVGTPIAITRKTSNQYMGCLKEFKKDSNSYKFWGTLCSAPVAVISGSIKGTISGAHNAVHYSISRPFGKDAFSLGKLEDTVSAKPTAKSDSYPNPDKPESQPWGTPK
jgi:hypothetical protein